MVILFPPKSKTLSQQSRQSKLRKHNKWIGDCKLQNTQGRGFQDCVEFVCYFQYSVTTMKGRSIISNFCVMMMIQAVVAADFFCVGYDDKFGMTQRLERRKNFAPVLYEMKRSFQNGRRMIRYQSLSRVVLMKQHYCNDLVRKLNGKISSPLNRVKSSR